MPVETQYFLIPVASLAGFILGVVFLHRFIRAKAGGRGVRITSWVGGLMLIGGVCFGLGLMLMFAFVVYHPMDPPIKRHSKTFRQLNPLNRLV